MGEGLELRLFAQRRRRFNLAGVLAEQIFELAVLAFMMERIVEIKGQQFVLAEIGLCEVVRGQEQAEKSAPKNWPRKLRLPVGSR